MSPAAGHQVHGTAIYFRELVPESARKSPAIGGRRSATPAYQLYVELRGNAVEGLVVPQLAAAADDSGGDSFKRFSSSSSIFSAASSAFSKCRWKQAGAMNLLKIKCKIIITIAMTTTTDEAGLQLTTILIATTTTILASLLKTLSWNFPEDLELFLLLFLLNHLLLLLLHHHSWISEAGLIKILLAILQALTQQEVGWC